MSDHDEILDYPPQIDLEQLEPEVIGEIGGHVTLRCAVKGNPTPRITWSKDGIQVNYRNFL